MAISIKANLAAVQAWDATKTFSDLDPGVYKVETTEVAIHTKSDGKQSLEIHFDTVEPAVGPGVIYIGLDFSKEANARKMKTALISHGAKVEKIDAAGAGLEVTDAAFVGRPALVNVRLVDDMDEKGRKRLNDKEFIRPEDYEVLKARVPAKAAPTVAPSGQAPAKAAVPAAAADLFT